MSTSWETTVLSALALTAVLTGCRGGDGTTAPTSAAPTSAGVDAVARAKDLGPEINIRAADLPGLTGTAPNSMSDGGALPPAARAEAAACLGLSADDTAEFLGDDKPDLSEAASQDFKKGSVPGLELSSKVDVSEKGGVSSPAFARFFPLVFSEKGARCFGDLFATAAEIGVGNGTSFTVTDSSLFAVPALAGQQSGGIRARLSATISGQQVGFEFAYAAIFQQDVNVTVTGVGTGQTIPAAPLSALLTTLGERLAANA